MRAPMSSQQRGPRQAGPQKSMGRRQYPSADIQTREMASTSSLDEDLQDYLHNTQQVLEAGGSPASFLECLRNC
jgi:hypothetical protein